VLFSRPARLGRVKSRLAAGIGAAEAWRFHRRTLRALMLRLARDQRWLTWLALPPGRDRRDRSWPVLLPALDQGRGDLGARMRRVFARLPSGPAVLIGSDIPAVGAHHVAAAFRALGRAEAVFGPARDGGYWLVGLSRAGRRLDPFTGIAWSTPRTLADTLARLGPGVRVALVATLEDVDDEAAYARWRAASRRARQAARSA
jgi:rSAM/selenodomain-associated transferase 1